MALEMNDIMTLKALGGNGHEMTPYEQFKVGHMQSRRPSGVAIGALATGVAGVVVALGAGLYANAKANAAKDVAAAQNAGTAALLNSMAQTLAAERAERINGDQFTFTQTQTDTQSGSQQGTLTAMQTAEQVATQTVMAGLMTGQYSQNPQRVALYRDATPCGCPATGCGCNG